MGKVRILLVADGRSPITRNWIKMLQSGKYEICLASTYPYQPIDGLISQVAIPVGFSALAGGQVNSAEKTGSGLRQQMISALRPLLMRTRAALTPHMLRAPMKKLQAFIDKCKPDVVHAMRIPYEGMLCSHLPDMIPLVMSIWGNDLTLHAKTSRHMGVLTHRTLKRADGLLADAARDVQLAQAWSLQKDVPTLVVPGSGGLDLSALKTAWEKSDMVLARYHIPRDRPLVINPRGFRPGSVHQDVFFKSIPLVLERMPDTFFLCPGMQGQTSAERRLRSLGISASVMLLPFLPQEELWALYAASSVYLSLSSHDGTPNSFLEAIASGTYPIVGDIASLREWITPGQTGSLIDPRDAGAAAREVCGVLGNENLRGYAAKKNRTIIETRALREGVREKVELLYANLI